MVKVCAAVPAVAEEGERLVILGTGFDAGGGEEVLPPPPPHDTETAKVSTTSMEMATRRVSGVLESKAFVSSGTVGYLEWGSLGTDSRQ